MMSAFDRITRCRCGEWPVLENNSGAVSFVCPKCERRSKPVREGEGAGYRAMLMWNKENHNANH